MRACVCLSVCLSVMLVTQAKTIKLCRLLKRLKESHAGCRATGSSSSPFCLRAGEAVVLAAVALAAVALAAAALPAAVAAGEEEG